MITQKKIIGTAVLTVGIVLCAACALLLRDESDFLFRAQELNLWMPTSQFYDTLAKYPGGALAWLSTFCTQFFYYPALGVAMLFALWSALASLTAVTFRVPARWSVLLLIAPAALLTAIVQSGYFVFYSKTPGYLFSPTLGLLFSLSSVWRWRKLPNRYGLPFLGMAVWQIVGYPLLGAWSFAGTAYMVLSAWLTPSRGISHCIVLTLCAALLVSGMPLTAYYFYSQTGMAHLWTAGLPCFQVAAEKFEAYRFPYYVMAIAWLPAALAGRFDKASVRTWMCIGIQVAILGGLVWGVNDHWYRDANFHKELKITYAINQRDWEGILKIARDGSTGEPSRYIVMARNLALFRLGRAGNEMFHYPEGGRKPEAPFTVRMAQTDGKLLYYHYGKENFAYRWCMEDCVEFGWRVENLKLMVKTCILSGEPEVARRYLDMLRHTTFHAEWADRYEALLNQPEALKRHEEFAPITQLMNYKNLLDGDNALVELYLLNSFAGGYGADTLFQEQAVISALQLRNIELFWPSFFRYAQITQGKPMPIHYQEAAYLYGNLEKKVDISRMPFDKEVKESYARFMEFNSRCGSMTDAQKAAAFYPQFGHTFYYYYFLVRNIKTN